MVYPHLSVFYLFLLSSQDQAGECLTAESTSGYCSFGACVPDGVDPCDQKNENEPCETATIMGTCQLMGGVLTCQPVNACQGRPDGSQCMLTDPAGAQQDGNCQAEVCVPNGGDPCVDFVDPQKDNPCLTCSCDPNQGVNCEVSMAVIIY